MKLIIVNLSTLILSSCAPIEALDKLPDIGKLIVIISICFFIAFIFRHPELKPSFYKNDNYERPDDNLFTKLNTIYWLLIIIIILLIIVLYKIW